MVRLCVLAPVMLMAAAAMPAGGLGCTLCVGLPKETEADHLLASRCVLLAREAPGQPYTYAPRKVLSGRFDGGQIDLLLDTATRRLLAADEQRNVLLVQEESAGTWQSLGIASEEFETVVRRILAHAPAWQGESGRRARIEFFVPLFGHADEQISRLAYLELGRAPYHVIRRLGRSVSRTDYAAILTDPRRVQWRSLAILLLAQSDAPEDARYIRRSLKSAHEFQLTTNLAAWASAAIEVDGAEAIAFLQQHYCGRSDRTPVEIQAVFQALSVHGAENTRGLRKRIVDAFRVLAETHPGMRAHVTRALGDWNQQQSFPQGDSPETPAAAAARDARVANSNEHGEL